VRPRRATTGCPCTDMSGKLVRSRWRGWRRGSRWRRSRATVRAACSPAGGHAEPGRGASRTRCWASPSRSVRGGGENGTGSARDGSPDRVLGHPPRDGCRVFPARTAGCREWACAATDAIGWTTPGGRRHHPRRGPEQAPVVIRTKKSGTSPSEVPQHRSPKQPGGVEPPNAHHPPTPLLASAGGYQDVHSHGNRGGAACQSGSRSRLCSWITLARRSAGQSNASTPS
jgi:hypothetical protein